MVLQFDQVMGDSQEVKEEITEQPKPKARGESKANPDIKRPGSFEDMAKNVFDEAKDEVNKSKEGKDTPKEGAKTTEAEKKKYKIKYNGKEEEVEVDDNAIVEALQKSRDYTKKTQEAAEDRKQAAEARKQAETIFKLLDNLKEDPNGIFDFGKQFLNHDIEAIAEQRVLEKLKYEMMSPEDRERYDLTKENESYKIKEENRRKAEEADALRNKEETEQAERHKQEAEFSQSIKDYFEKQGIKPSSHDFYAMVKLLDLYWDTPNQMTIEQAWQKSQEAKNMTRKEILESLTVDDIPESLKKAIRQADVASFKTSKPWERTSKEQSIPKVNGKKVMSSEQFLMEMEKQYKGR